MYVINAVEAVTENPITVLQSEVIAALILGRKVVPPNDVPSGKCMEGSRLFVAGPGDHGAPDKTLAGQCHLETGARLVRPEDRGALKARTPQPESSRIRPAQDITRRASRVECAHADGAIR
jgi:hypothetical protein